MKRKYTQIIFENMEYEFKNSSNKNNLQNKNKNKKKKKKIENINTNEKFNSQKSKLQSFETKKNFVHKITAKSKRNKIIESIAESINLSYRKNKTLKFLNIERECGVLLYGPPGVGKTTTSSSVCDLCFKKYNINAKEIKIDCSKLLSKYIGETEKNLNVFFEMAKKNSFTIFLLDEIDCILVNKSMNNNTNNSAVIETINAFIDFAKKKSNIFIIATTNYLNKIDSTLIRPGRLKKIEYGYLSKVEMMNVFYKYSERWLNENIIYDLIIDIVENDMPQEKITGALVKELCSSLAMDILKEIIDKQKKNEKEKFSNKFENFKAHINNAEILKEKTKDYILIKKRFQEKIQSYFSNKNEIYARRKLFKQHESINIYNVIGCVLAKNILNKNVNLICQSDDENEFKNNNKIIFNIVTKHVLNKKLSKNFIKNYDSNDENINMTIGKIISKNAIQHIKKNLKEKFYFYELEINNFLKNNSIKLDYLKKIYNCERIFIHIKDPVDSDNFEKISFWLNTLYIYYFDKNIIVLFNNCDDFFCDKFNDDYEKIRCNYRFVKSNSTQKAYEIILKTLFYSISDYYDVKIKYNKQTSKNKTKEQVISNQSSKLKKKVNFKEQDKKINSMEKILNPLKNYNHQFKRFKYNVDYYRDMNFHYIANICESEEYTNLIKCISLLSQDVLSKFKNKMNNLIVEMNEYFNLCKKEKNLLKCKQWDSNKFITNTFKNFIHNIDFKDENSLKVLYVKTKYDTFINYLKIEYPNFLSLWKHNKNQNQEYKNPLYSSDKNYAPENVFYIDEFKNIKKSLQDYNNNSVKVFEVADKKLNSFIKNIPKIAQNLLLEKDSHGLNILQNILNSLGNKSKKDRKIYLFQILNPFMPK